MSNVFGRTNIPVPSLWYSLHIGSEPEQLVKAATTKPTVIDVTPSPALWGNFLQDSDALVMVSGGREVENAVNEHHASDLISAHLIQTLSSLTRPTLDFYFLKVRNPLTEHQINGALAALDDAKNDGLLRYIGLMVDGSAFDVTSLWRFHDAFEAVLVRNNPQTQEDFQAISAIASEKRAGLATFHPFGHTPQSLNEKQTETLKTLTENHPVLLPVNSADQVPSGY